MHKKKIVLQNWFHPDMCLPTYALNVTNLHFQNKGLQDTWKKRCSAQTLHWDVVAIYILAPCWSVLEFWKIKLDKSSSTNWIFSLQKSILKMIFAGYTGSKNPVWNRLKIQFIKLDFSKLIFFRNQVQINRGIEFQPRAAVWIFSLI